ncbi:hypothetical protein ACQJBY_054743 [Aegilops geniculata]
MVLLGEEAPDLRLPALDLRTLALDLLSGAAPQSVLAPAASPRGSGIGRLPRRLPATRLDAMKTPWILSSNNSTRRTERRMKTLSTHALLLFGAGLQETCCVLKDL